MNIKSSLRKVLTVILVLVGVTCVYWVAKGWTLGKHPDERLAKFNADCDNLILGFQQYHEFVGSYPTGNNVTITKALLGQTGRKVLILTVRRSDINDKGEIIDPWGTPYQFYFSNDQVLIRSAGPNKAFEDSANANADDLFRCAGKQK